MGAVQRHSYMVHQRIHIRRRQHRYLDLTPQKCIFNTLPRTWAFLDIPLDYLHPPRPPRLQPNRRRNCNNLLLFTSIIGFHQASRNRARHQERTNRTLLCRLLMPISALNSRVLRAGNARHRVPISLLPHRQRKTPLRCSTTLPDRHRQVGLDAVRTLRDITVKRVMPPEAPRNPATGKAPSWSKIMRIGSRV
jgi:hypothetical protein